MIPDLKPYPEYRESGLVWLQKIPAHWEIKRAKSIFQPIDQRSTAGREELLTVSSALGVVPRKTVNVTMFKAESYVGYKLCWPGDLVINSLWAWAGGLGVSNHHGIISSAYGVYRIRPNVPLVPAFIHEIARSASFSWELRVRSKGIWISRLQLSDVSFLDAPIYIPPPDEQEAIVRFLGWARERLERAIRTKQKVIALLNERRQAIIQRAVTRGLDLSAPLKPSGSPGLGNIPMHWEVKRAKFLFNKIDVRSRTGDEELLTVSSSDGVVPRSTKTVMMFKAASYIGHKLCWPHDLVINSLWAWARGLGFSKHHGIVSTAYGVYRPKEAYRGHWEYLNELLRSPAYDWDFHVRSKGIWKSRLQLTDDAFFDMRIALPPEKEAIEIVRHIEDSTRELSSIISQAKGEIHLLREYHTRIADDVVTGKLDVRKAAALLPVETVAETGEGEVGIDISEERESADEEAAV